MQRNVHTFYLATSLQPECVGTYKLLGVIISDDLKRNAHVEFVIAHVEFVIAAKTICT